MTEVKDLKAAIRDIESSITHLSKNMDDDTEYGEAQKNAMSMALSIVHHAMHTHGIELGDLDV